MFFNPGRKNSKVNDTRYKKSKIPGEKSFIAEIP